MLARCILAWVVIIAVAAYDNSLMVQTAPALPDTEQNPISALLIGQDGAGLSTFVGLKTAGTALAVLVSFLLWQRPALRRAVTLSVCCVATLQIGLFVYLTQDYRFEHLRRMDRMIRVQSLEGAQKRGESEAAARSDEPVLAPRLRVAPAGAEAAASPTTSETGATPRLQVAPPVGVE